MHRMQNKSPLSFKMVATYKFQNLASGGFLKYCDNSLQILTMNYCVNILNKYIMQLQSISSSKTETNKKFESKI